MCINTCKKGTARVFLLVLSDKTKGSRPQIQNCYLSIRKNFFSLKVIEHWNKLPRAVVESPSLEIIRTGLNIVQSNPL